MNIRLSPSGPVVGVAGTGFRLRLDEANSPMTGSQAIPGTPTVICPDGFANTDAIVLTLAAPTTDNNYRAMLELDVLNTSTNVEGEVVLYLDVSVDGGVTYANVAKNVHLIAPIPAGITGSTARAASLRLTQTAGVTLGVVAGTPSIKLRARAQTVSGTAGSLLVSSLATSDGGTPVTNLVGTIHMELEECILEN